MSVNQISYINEDNYEDDCDLMETVQKTKKNGTISYLKQLETLFDIVEVTLLEDKAYSILSCKNRVNKNGIEYEVWLNLKVKKNFIEDISQDIIQYKDKLFNESKPKQLSLFEDEKSNAKTIEDLTFWEVFSDYYLYDNDLYLHTIPKNDKDMIEVIKSCIELYLEDPTKEYEHFNFDDKYNHLRTNKPISDREVLSRLFFCLRIHFGLSINVDDKYLIDLSNKITVYSCKGTKKYKFYASYYACCYRIELDCDDFITYDLYDIEFCNWLRKKFNIPYREPYTDNETIKKCFLDFSEKFTSKEQLYKIIDISKDAKDFRIKFLSYLKSIKDTISSHGGGGSLIDDCYSFSYGYGLSNLEFRISQLNSYRKQLNREIVEHNDSWNQDYTYILAIKGDKVFEEMYNVLSNKPIYIQTSVFDF